MYNFLRRIAHDCAIRKSRNIRYSQNQWDNQLSEMTNDLQNCDYDNFYSNRTLLTINNLNVII